MEILIISLITKYYLFFRQSSVIKAFKYPQKAENSFISKNLVILQLYLKIMAAIMTKNTTKAVISTDDLKELLECPVCYILFILDINYRTIIKFSSNFIRLLFNNFLQQRFVYECQEILLSINVIEAICYAMNAMGN